MRLKGFEVALLVPAAWAAQCVIGYWCGLYRGWWVLGSFEEVSALARAEVPQLRRVRRQDFAFAPGVDVTDVGQVKGLEFDYVILLDVNATSYPDTVEARHLLHIGATRATHQLWLVSTGPVSPLLPVDESGALRAEEERAEATASDRSTSPAS